MSLDRSVTAWLRQSFAWPAGRAVWRERAVMVALLLIAAALVYLSGSLDIWKSAVLWAGYLLLLAVCTAQGWIKLFGPVLFYDMIRTARRSRYALLRLLYAGLLLFVLCTTFMAVWFERSAEANRLESAILAQQFFALFMLVQIVVVVLLTPAYVAGAIAEEKDRKTLEFMLATDLHNREIVLSKLCSRLANMGLLLITGLPILSILQFVGGVDLDLMLAGFAGTAMTMLGLASLSILMSTLFQKPRDAIGVTYLLIVTYAIGFGMLTGFRDIFPNLMKTTLWESKDAPSLADLVEWVNAGNPLLAIGDVIAAIEGHSRIARGTPTSLAVELPGILTRYSMFHAGLTAICVVWSVLRLRAIALKQTAGGTARRLRWWEQYRPEIGEWPMMWKELHIEGGMKSNWLVKGAVFVLILITLGSGLLVVSAWLWQYFLVHNAAWHQLQEEMNVWFRVAGTAVGSLLLLMIAVRAATCITHERERDTLDALLTTPMTSESMLSAKLIGAVMSLRLGWIWYGSMITLAVVTGGVHLVAVPLVLVSWFVFALFFAMVGMWFSMTCASSMRSTVLTVLMVLFLGGGHWIFSALCFYLPLSIFMRAGGQGDFIMYVVQFETALTPPAVLGICAYSWEELAHHANQHNSHGEWLTFCLIGLFLWLLACAVLWYALLLPKFKLLTRREELIYQ